MAKFSPPFAWNGERRSTTSDEQEYGIPCGPFDRKMWNNLFYEEQAELGNLINYSGQTGNPDDLSQVSKAIQSGRLNAAAATGTVNDLLVNMSPQLMAYEEFIPVTVRTLGTNTGPVTVNVNQLGKKVIVSSTGLPLSGGEMPSVAQLIYIGGAFVLMNPRQASSMLMAPNGYLSLNINGGTFLMQWGRFSGTTLPEVTNWGIYESPPIAVTWPIAFPSMLLQAVGGTGSDVQGAGYQEQAWFLSTNQIGGFAAVAARGEPYHYLEGTYIAFGC